jgi:hypothetical protein
VKQATPAVRGISEMPLTPRDAEVGVISDRIVELTGRGAPKGRFRRELDRQRQARRRARKKLA